MGLQGHAFAADNGQDCLDGVACAYRGLALELGLTFCELGLKPAADGDFSKAILTGVAALDPSCAPLRYALCPPLARFGHLRNAGVNGRTDFAVMPPQAFKAMLRLHHRDTIVDTAVRSLERTRPGESAIRGLTGEQIAVLVAIGFVLGGILFLETGVALWLLTLATLPLFYALIMLRLSAVIDAWSPLKPGAMPLRDRDLPVYTVLVPLYREAKVVPQLARALAQLDYPVDKLDIKILTEEGDAATLAALNAVGLPSHIEVLVAPASFPRTKPRALNIGLLEARGSLLAIFDAEDRPDPRQLRLAANLFHRLPDNVACLQGHLVIDNSDDGILTRFFALEYAGLFDVLNVGLTRVGLPVLLGGTSNHLRTEVLRALGGWDAWNVTEDADLSFRLVRAGYRILDLPSVTLEEAPAGLWLWLRQRTRWMKGFLQTTITHTRDPLRLLREVGVARGFALLALCTGAVVTSLIYPVCFLTALTVLIGSGLPAVNDAGGIVFASLWVTLMLGGLVALLAPMALGARHRGLGDLAVWLPLVPFYYLLVSVAAWLAVAEYVRAPTQWNKTDHGLAKTSRRRRTQRPAHGQR